MAPSILAQEIGFPVQETLKSDEEIKKAIYSTQTTFCQIPFPFIDKIFPKSYSIMIGERAPEPTLPIPSSPIGRLRDHRPAPGKKKKKEEE